MTEQEQQIANTLREGAAAGWRFMYLGDSRKAIRGYNQHGVTIITVDISETSDEVVSEYFDIILPNL